MDAPVLVDDAGPGRPPRRDRHKHPALGPGDRVGGATVLGVLPDYVSAGNRFRRVHARCDACGFEWPILEHNLRARLGCKGHKNSVEVPWEGSEPAKRQAGIELQETPTNEPVRTCGLGTGERRKAARLRTLAAAALPAPGPEEVVQAALEVEGNEEEDAGEKPKQFSGLRRVWSRPRGEPLVLGDAVTTGEIRADPEMHAELIRAFQENRPGAAELLLEIHDQFVKSRAYKYKHTCHEDLEDLLQEGRIAMLEACARWDPGKAGDGKPLSYIFPYVRHYVGRYATQRAHVVRFTLNAIKKRGRYFPKCWFFSELDADKRWVTGESVADDPESESFAETITSSDAVDAEEVLCGADLLALMPGAAAALLEDCKDKEREVLRRRFAEQPEALQVIGEHYGISRERIRQIESKGLRRARSRAEDLRCGVLWWEVYDGARTGTFEEWLMALSMRLGIFDAERRGKLADLAHGELLITGERELRALVLQAKCKTAHLWPDTKPALSRF